jgi:GNAT superfamily N-acetyltransferase
MLAAMIELIDDQHPAAAQLTLGLMQFNERHGRAYDFVPLRLAQLDAASNIYSGLLGATGWGWLSVDVLFVPPALRGSGLGRALMLEAMAVAKARGCSGAMLDTFSFQALGFYQKLGFEVFGTLEHMPPGHQRFWLKRAL